MTTDSATPSAQFEIGRVITRMFEVIGSNFFTLFALAALLSMPVLLMTFASLLVKLFHIHVAFPETGPAPGIIGAIVVAAFIGALIYFLFVNFLHAAMTYATIVSLNGGHASFGDSLMTGVRNVLPLILISIVSTFGVAVGMILLIIPGLILAMAWAVAIPVRVAERTGILQTLGRSAELTRGHRGSIFGLFVIVGFISGAISIAIGPLAGVSFAAAAGGNIPITFIVLKSAATILTSLIGATMVASVYYELRMVKEGIGPEQLAAIFA